MFYLLSYPSQLALAAEGGGGIPDWLWLIIIIVFLLILFLLLITLGKKQGPSDEVKAAPVIEAVAPDDLKKIEGIGPKINSLLQEAGINTYAELAAASVDKIDAIIDAAGITFADPTTWPQQAKLAADGKWEELEKLQDELSGGKKVKPD